jgi:hypothetical protein
MKKGMYTEAKEEFRKALLLNPYYTDAQVNLEEAIKLEKLHRRHLPPPPVEEKIPERKPIAKPPPIALPAFLKSTYFIVPAAFCFLLISVLTLKSIIVKEPNLKVFTLPMDSISSFCLHKNNIYLANWSSRMIYLGKIKKEIIIKRKRKTTTYPSFITIAGNSLLLFDALRNKISYHLLDESLTLKKSKSFPPIYPTNIVFSGRKVWVVDQQSNRLYELSEDMKIISSYKSLKEKIKKLLHDGKNFYLLDYENNLYQLSPKNKNTIIKKLSLIIPANRDISDIALTKKYIWVKFTDENSLYRFLKKYYLTP